MGSNILFLFLGQETDMIFFFLQHELFHLGRIAVIEF